MPRRYEPRFRDESAGMRFVTMPNPRLCRIEVLKRSGNCVNPVDPPSCNSAPCGIVRCAFTGISALAIRSFNVLPFLW
jgi:hypothetical protein